MKNRILSLCIASIVAFSCMSFSAFASESQEYQKEINLVKALRIMVGYEDGNFHGDKNITRAEFTKIMIGILGHNDAAKAYVGTKFSDVGQDHWANGYISMASELGIIAGYGNGMFGPNDNITMHQCITILVSALGYKGMAEAKGGYPKGYINIANDNNILKGLNTRDTSATRAQAAKLIYNALEVPFAEIQNFKANGQHVVEKGDVTILSCMGYYKTEGYVTDVFGINTSNDDDLLKKDEVKINEIRFKTVMNDCSPFILKKVDLWYKEDEYDNNVIYHMEEKAGTEDVVIDADDIDESTTLNKIIYMSEKSKRKTIDLPQNLAIVYNGQLVGTRDYSDKLLKPLNGNVKLIDLDRNGEYEYALVNEYVNYVVETISNNKIFDLFSDYVNLDEDDDVTSSIYFENESVSIESIKQYDILSVSKSLDGKNVKIEICRDTVSGTIEMEATDQDGEIYFTIDGTEYKLADNYKKAYISNNGKLKKLKQGDSGIFYLDSSKKIAYSKETEIKEKAAYGYIIDIALKKNLSQTGEVKIMTANNEFENFEFAKQITFGRMQGGTYVKEKVSAEKIYKKIKPEYDVEMQVVKYTLDNEGKIKGFYLADTNPNSDNFSLDVERNKYYYANNVLDNKYILNTNTVWLDIPESGLYTDLFSAGYAVNYLKPNTTYTIELYEVHNNVAELALCKSNMARLLTYSTKVIVDKVNSPIMFVDKVTGCQVDGEWRTCINGWVRDKYVTVPLSDELAASSKTLKDIKSGTIVQYETNYAEIKRAETSDDLEVLWAYNVLHDFNATPQDYYQLWNNTTIESNNAGLGTIYGEVTDVNFPYCTVKYKNQYGEEAYTTQQFGAQALVFKYNTVSKAWQICDQREIVRGSVVFIRRRYNNLREAVILDY